MLIMLRAIPAIARVREALASPELALVAGMLSPESGIVPLSRFSGETLERLRALDEAVKADRERLDVVYEKWLQYE